MDEECAWTVRQLQVSHSHHTPGQLLPGLCPWPFLLFIIYSFILFIIYSFILFIIYSFICSFYYLFIHFLCNTFHLNCLIQLREKYGPLPTESSVSSNSTSSNCTSSTNSSCSGTSKSCSNISSSPDQGCCDLSYLQTHCASHLLESIKDTSNKLFADYRHLTGYYWCDWIDRNRASLTASLLQLFSWC